MILFLIAYAVIFFARESSLTCGDYGECTFNLALFQEFTER